jgi:hypothetical protein
MKRAFLALSLLAILCVSSPSQQRSPIEQMPDLEQRVDSNMAPALACHTELLCVCGWEGKGYICNLYEVWVCD